MNDEQIRAVVAQLDALVPRDGAYIAHEKGFYGSEHDPGYTGNRLGYLRFGIELLKLANAPSNGEQPDRVSVDLIYLGDATLNQGDHLLFERRQDIPDRSHRAYVAEPYGLQWITESVIRLTVYAFAAVVGLVVASAIVLGLRDILLWVW